jgi:hypothetical protein
MRREWASATVVVVDGHTVAGADEQGLFMLPDAAIVCGPENGWYCVQPQNRDVR